MTKSAKCRKNVPLAGRSCFGLYALALSVAVATALTALMFVGCNDPIDDPGDDKFAMYELTTSAFPASGGTVTREPNYEKYQKGTVVTLTAESLENYEFEGWTGASASESPVVAVTMTGDMEVAANFKPVHHTLLIDMSHPDAGTVTRVPSSPTYPHGTEVVVVLEQADKEKYVFAGWSGASESKDTVVTVTMNSNVTLRAEFLLIGANHHALITDITPSGSGTVERYVGDNLDNSITYPHGTAVTLKAVPTNPEMYRFISWSGASTSTYDTITVTMNTNITLTANFMQMCRLIVNRDPVEGGTITITANDAVSTSAMTSHDVGTEVTVKAEAADGYVFSGWSGTSISSTNPEMTFVMSGDQTLTANFVQTHTLTVNWNPGEGAITRNPNSSPGLPDGTYIVGATVTVTAMPNENHMFAGWSGASELTDTVVTVTMNGNQELAAKFVPALLDRRDGKRYRVVKIGTQVWMAENLNYSIGAVAGEYCYANNGSNCVKFGKLYNWNVASRVCPAGWRLPNNTNDSVGVGRLIRFAAAAAGANSKDDEASIRLKAEDGGWDDVCDSQNNCVSGNGTDEFGFSALPGGFWQHIDGVNFHGVGKYGRWWTSDSTEVNGEIRYNGWGINAENKIIRVGEEKNGRDYGYSVRCIKND